MDRRQFIVSTLAGGAALYSRPGMAAAGFDLALTDVQALIAGSFQRCDLGVSAGRIAAIAEPGTLTGAQRVITGKGLMVSPGWTDLHVHLVDWRHGKTAGSPISRLGAAHGVTALTDAGTTGVANFQKFQRAAADDPSTPTYAFINICKEGIKLSDYYRTKAGWDDVPAMEKLVPQHRDRIAGIKYRADHQVSPPDDRTYYLRKCREAGDRLQLPVMIHISGPPPSLTEILPLLKEGDLVTHFLRGQGHCIIDGAGKVRDDVKDAYARGVRFDLGHGVASFSYAAAERALDQGFLDFTISSDLYIISAPLYARTFANVLTQLLLLKMPLADVMERAGARPGRFLKLEREIKPGAEATLTVFSVAEGDFTLTDVTREKRKTDKRVIPEWTILAGKPIRAGDLDRKLFLKGQA